MRFQYHECANLSQEIPQGMVIIVSLHEGFVGLTLRINFSIYRCKPVTGIAATIENFRLERIK